MSVLATATSSIKPTNHIAFYLSQIGAVILTIVTLSQLFTFELFPNVLSAYPLPGGYETATALAALIVTLEVFSVPYLLMIRLSPLMRGLSMMCGWMVCLVWAALGLYIVAYGDGMMNSGLLGATIDLRSGWLPLILSGTLFAGLLSFRHAADKKS